MDANEILTMISQYGFPIVACCYLAWNQKTTIEKFRDSIDRNSNLVERLIEKLGDEK